VRRVTVGGHELDLRPLTNPSRRAGVAVRAADLLSAHQGTEIIVETH
jgi:hypothetical protein